jgi:thiol-disulfide isomerase/thioredoxin
VNPSLLWQTLILILIGMSAAQAFILVAVMRQLGGVMVQLNPARIGEVDGGPDVDSHVEVPGAEDGRPAIVLFVASDCGLCHLLTPSIPAVRQHFLELDFVTVVLGDDADARREYARRLSNGARDDLVDLGRNWDVPGTPFAVGVDGTGRVRARGVVNTLDHLEALAETVVRLHARDVLGHGGDTTDREHETTGGEPQDAAVPGPEPPVRREPEYAQEA